MPIDGTQSAKKTNEVQKFKTPEAKNNSSNNTVNNQNLAQLTGGLSSIRAQAPEQTFIEKSNNTRDTAKDTTTSKDGAGGGSGEVITEVALPPVSDKDKSKGGEGEAGGASSGEAGAGDVSGKDSNALKDTAQKIEGEIGEEQSKLDSLRSKWANLISKGNYNEAAQLMTEIKRVEQNISDLNQKLAVAQEAIQTAEAEEKTQEAKDKKGKEVKTQTTLKVKAEEEKKEEAKKEEEKKTDQPLPDQIMLLVKGIAEDMLNIGIEALGQIGGLFTGQKEEDKDKTRAPQNKKSL